jgi:hypothetical protein
MKFKKNSPFLDEVTAHGELFKGPKEVFVCPECGSEHVDIGENLDFGLPNEYVFEVMETRRECVCKDCGCEFKRIYGRKRALSDTSKGIFLVIMGVILIIAALVSLIFWFKLVSSDPIGKTVYDEIIVAVVWGIGAVLVGIFGGMLIEIGSCDL